MSELAGELKICARITAEGQTVENISFKNQQLSGVGCCLQDQTQSTRKDLGELKERQNKRAEDLQHRLQNLHTTWTEAEDFHHIILSPDSLFTGMCMLCPMVIFWSRKASSAVPVARNTTKKYHCRV